MGVFVVQAFLAGCAHGHVATLNSGQIQERELPQPTFPPVVTYAIPLIAPKGMVCVRSLGHEQLPGPRGRLRSFLHISVAAENATDNAMWTLDPRDMKLNFIDSVWPVSAYSKTLAKAATLSIVQGKRGQIDLYFPSARKSRPLYVSFLWKLHRGNETDTISTRFENAGPSPTVNENGSAPANCGLLSRVADRHATVSLLAPGNPI